MVWGIQYMIIKHMQNIRRTRLVSWWFCSILNKEICQTSTIIECNTVQRATTTRWIIAYLGKRTSGCWLMSYEQRKLEYTRNFMRLQYRLVVLTKVEMNLGERDRKNLKLLLAITELLTRKTTCVQLYSITTISFVMTAVRLIITNLRNSNYSLFSRIYYTHN